MNRIFDRKIILEDGTVTVRDRDTMEQIRMPIDQLIAHIEQECDF